jgi:hypothetical protein
MTLGKQIHSHMLRHSERYDGITQVRHIWTHSPIIPQTQGRSIPSLGSWKQKISKNSPKTQPGLTGQTAQQVPETHRGLSATQLTNPLLHPPDLVPIGRSKLEGFSLHSPSLRS